MESNVAYRMLIGGQLVGAARQMDVVNPATGKAFAKVPVAGQAELDQAVEAAQAAFVGWKATPLAERQAAVRKVADLLEANADELARLFTLENGRPLPGAMMEVQGAARWLRGMAEYDIPVEVTEDTPVRRVEVHREPLGVVCGLAPWNFPIMLGMFKSGPAILAGNTVVLKPSPFTPLCTLRIAELVKDVFPAGVLNVITGEDDLGPLMTAHPGFAKISFTGSTATGKRVAEAAAHDLKRVTLELGGNDACIVLADADPAVVAEKVFLGAFGNTGQVCVATKRLYVHEDIFDAVRDGLHEIAKAAKVGDGTEQGVMIGPIQNERQHQRLIALLEDARREGLTLLQGGPVPDQGYFIPITIVDRPPEASRVVQEEAFGPILPVMSFRDLDEVIERANASHYGLGGSVWSSDIAKAVAVAHRMDTGTVWINSTSQLAPTTPIGGHKQSGLGVESGRAGLLEYTQTKVIFIPKPQAA